MDSFSKFKCELELVDIGLGNSRNSSLSLNLKFNPKEAITNFETKFNNARHVYMI
jgi:hypothetical protein